MSSSKIKKRTLPTVPAKDVKSSPATTSAIVNSAIKQAAARALFQGKKKDFISTSRPISPSAPQNSPKHINRRSNQIKSATTVSTPSPKSLKTNKAPVKNNAKSIPSTKKRKENLNSANSINQSNHQESEQELQEKKINLKQKRPLLLRADLPTKGCNDDKSSIIVAVRVRPFNMREVSQGATRIVSMEGNMTMLSNPSTSSFHDFTYDYSFWSFDSTDPVAPFMSQENIYESVAKPLLNYSFEGYNTCLFAYGQPYHDKGRTLKVDLHYEIQSSEIDP